MLDYAINKVNADFCCILSGNCIPVKTFAYLEDNLENLPISRFLITDLTNLKGIFNKKQSQWCILSLEHIQIILKYKDKYMQIFKVNNFVSIDNIYGAPDEYFYITLLSKQGVTNFTTDGSTYCNWSKLMHYGHPKEYKCISLKELAKIKKSNYFFARKILKKCLIVDNEKLFVDEYDVSKNVCDYSKFDIELDEVFS